MRADTLLSRSQALSRPVGRRPTTTILGRPRVSSRPEASNQARSGTDDSVQLSGSALASDGTDAGPDRRPGTVGRSRQRRDGEVEVQLPVATGTPGNLFLPAG
jgi:hypothetical protein